MSSLNWFIVLALCLCQALDSSNAFHKRRMTKRFNLRKNRDPDTPQIPIGTDGYIIRRGIFFEEGSINGSTQEGVEFENVALYCRVGGVPSPSVHWLKDGKRIVQAGSCGSQDDDEDLNGFADQKLSSYSTFSTLYIDCLDETDQANYTCVAQTATHRETRSVYLTVARSETPALPTLKACARKGRPARIYLATNSVLELENNNVRLFCRAQGNPTPTITWFDADNRIIQAGGNYLLSKNGDLIITNINWFEHMGVYTCEAQNVYGNDSTSPFLYPTARD
ncbi:hypothetical protein RRG08_003230 [Elysia crispata]|uniref:Ig-like domain-containing protein n=1 Tax=Elysia crispata TaxID=231223 RepID=A0AAE1B0B3_9GAST|nr:hypothetical protein RRG08_003230 [Elysia crispata]